MNKYEHNEENDVVISIVKVGCIIEVIAAIVYGWIHSDQLTMDNFTGWIFQSYMAITLAVMIAALVANKFKAYTLGMSAAYVFILSFAAYALGIITALAHNAYIAISHVCAAL